MPADHPRVRLARLLHHLTTDEFRSLPTNVGRKTVNLGLEAQLIEAESKALRPRCRLTEAGQQYRSSHPYPLHEL
jgi:hypothetical protein